MNKKKISIRKSTSLTDEMEVVSLVPPLDYNGIGNCHAPCMLHLSEHRDTEWNSSRRTDSDAPSVWSQPWRSMECIVAFLGPRGVLYWPVKGQMDIDYPNNRS